MFVTEGKIRRRRVSGKDLRRGLCVLDDGDCDGKLTMLVGTIGR